MPPDSDFNHQQPQFDFAAPSCQMVTITLPGKQITVDLQNGQIYDQPLDNLSILMSADAPPTAGQNGKGNGTEKIDAPLQHWITKFIYTKRIRMETQIPGELHQHPSSLPGMRWS